MKLVPEHINEFLSFKRDNENSLVNLGVGKVSLIKSWLDEMKIKNYIINDNLTIDVNGVVRLWNKNLVKFPDYIKFNKVDGFFDCGDNRLSNLEGCPKYVNEDFSCAENNLISLEDCPTYVGGSFWCRENKNKFTLVDVKQLCNVKGNIYV